MKSLCPRLDFRGRQWITRVPATFLCWLRTLFWGHLGTGAPRPAQRPVHQIVTECNILAVTFFRYGSLTVQTAG